MLRPRQSVRDPRENTDAMFNEAQRGFRWPIIIFFILVEHW